MSRVKRGTAVRKKHKKILALTKGYRHGRNNLIKRAKEAILKAGVFSYRDRKVKKRVFRTQWIVSLNAALRKNDISYSKFIHLANKAGLELDRKVLANLAQESPEEFQKIVDQVKAKA